jgi:Na+/H+ antiporter NhaD/arsenite permease-like protein
VFARAFGRGSSDLREALEAYPVMGTLFNTEKHRMDAQRDAHFRRFATGGGNFRKGFKVKLRALGEREQLGQRVSEELETAFDPVPVAFSRDAVEALLLTKMQEMEDLRDQLGAAGVVEKDKELEEQEQGPLTKEQKRKTYLQMGTLAAIFFSLCFVPYISVQHHAQDVLLATSASHPALLHMSYYSEYRVDVVATIEGQPRGGIKQTSEADHVTEVTRSETSSNGDTGTGDGQRGDSASHGRRLQGSDPHDHHPHVTPTPQPSPSPTRPVQDCPIVDGYCDRGRPCRCVLDEQERLWEIEETHATLQAYIVRCDHEVAEHIAHGFINISHAMDPSTPRNRGVDIVDEGHLIKMKPEAQRMHVEFGMDGDMRDIDHEVEHVYLLVVTSSPDPIAMSLEVHDLGYTGPLQEWIALMILVIVFGMIVLEIVHHTLAAMFGSYMVLCVLAVQHRMPEISEVVGWMDHGTLALLWGMMIIVGVVAKTGVFEYMAVRLYKMSGGDPFRLLLLICFLDIILSAFLDNVTTMLLLAPVCVQLCEAVGRDPRPFLISLALFGNVGGTATMIGDPPNIIIGNMLHEYVTFNDFIIFLSPGVILCLPLSFFITKIYFGDSLSDKMEVNVEQLIKDNPIKNHRLLIKTGVMLCCVIIGFFLHPVTHIDPVFVAIPGAIAVFFLDNSHDVEDALHGVEWETLLFFAALFVMVEGLAEMGLLRKIASILADVIEDIPVASRQPMAIVLVRSYTIIYCVWG